MKQRIITAIVFVAAMLGGVFGGQLILLALFALITAGCLWELAGLLITEEESKMLRRVLGTFFGTFVYLFLSLSLIGILYQEDQAIFQMILIVIGFSIFVIELYLNPKQPFANIGYYFLGAIYLGLPFALLQDIAAPEFRYCLNIGEYYPLRVFGLLLLIWTNDTMAYFVGSQLGRRKLFERISPNKTWEGTIGGGICTVLMAWGLSFIIKDFAQIQWLALGVVAAVFGTLGDLVESMLKRSVGVKDSGNLLPGHGGLLDRFDAFIFALPFFWLALMVFRG